MSSDWISFVKNFAAINNIPYGQALRIAGPYYHQQKGSCGTRPRKSPGRKKKRKGGVVVRADQYNKMAGDILGYGGAKAQKGALAALLSGLDAQVKIN